MPAPHFPGASSTPLTRRTALKRGLAGILACGLAPNFFPARLFGKGAPSNRLTIGLVGNGLIAAHHVGILTGRPEDCRIVAISDVNRGKAEKMRERIEKAYGKDTDSGSPAPRVFESVRMSGATPSRSHANISPVRPTPVWASSTISSMPRSAHLAFSAAL